MDFNKINLNGLYTIELPLEGLDQTANYILKAADGLGPPSVAPRISQGVYHGKSVVERQIVLKIGLEPDWASGQRVGQLRDQLYGLLTPGVSDVITVELLLDSTVVANVKGQVSQMEINPFTREPEMAVTIDCYTPYLSAPAAIDLVPTSRSVPTILNEGTAPAGFTAELTFTAARDSWSLIRGSEQIRFDYSFAVDDILQFGTIEGNRYAQRKRGSSTVSILSSIASDFSWMQLHGGLNSFTVSPVVYEWGTVRYTPQYWGV